MTCPYGNPSCPNPGKPVGEGFHAACLTRRPRWSVRIGGYPNGWEPPIFSTDDPEDAISIYGKVRDAQRARHARYTTVAIFDDNGEGEPLDGERVRERLEEEEQWQLRSGR